MPATSTTRLFSVDVCCSITRLLAERNNRSIHSIISTATIVLRFINDIFPRDSVSFFISIAVAIIIIIAKRANIGRFFGSTKNEVVNKARGNMGAVKRQPSSSRYKCPCIRSRTARRRHSSLSIHAAAAVVAAQVALLESQGTSASLNDDNKTACETSATGCICKVLPNSEGGVMPAPLPVRRRNRRGSCRSSRSTLQLKDVTAEVIDEVAATSINVPAKARSASFRLTVQDRIDRLSFTTSPTSISADLIGGMTTAVDRRGSAQAKGITSSFPKRASKRSSIRAIAPTSPANTNTAAPFLIRTALKRNTATLLDLARIQDWPNLILRCKSHPRESRLKDADNLYPLHWACSGGPTVEAIRALLTVYKRAARRTDLEGSTALHFVCHYGSRNSVEVVELLLEAYPDAIRARDVHGRTPFYHAVNKGAGIDVLKALLKFAGSAEEAGNIVTSSCVQKYKKGTSFLNRSASLPPNSASTVLSTRAPRKKRLPSTPLGIAWNAVVLNSQCSRRKSGKQWDKAMLLLEIAYLGASTPISDAVKNPTNKRSFRMLHAALTFQSLLPSNVIEYALDLYPEQVQQREEDTGRLPLAISAASTSSGAISKKSSLSILQRLLQFYPQAAHIQDSTGRLPLYLALESGCKTWESGVSDIFEANPNVVYSQDVETRLQPFMMAAACSPVLPESNDVSRRTSLDSLTRSACCQDTSATVVATKLSEMNMAKKLADLKRVQFSRSIFPQQTQKCLMGNEGRATESICSFGYVDNVDVRHVNTIFELLRAFPSGVASLSC